MGKEEASLKETREERERERMNAANGKEDQRREKTDQNISTPEWDTETHEQDDAKYPIHR